MPFLALLGFKSRAQEASGDISVSAPTEGKKKRSTALELLTKEIIHLFKDVSHASPTELETNYSEFQKRAQTAVETLNPLREGENEGFSLIADSEVLGFLDDQLSAIKAKLSETEVHKEHVLAKLSSLRDGILSHVTEEGIFRVSGGDKAVKSLEERIDEDPSVDLTAENVHTLAHVFKRIVEEFGGKDSSLLKIIQEELLTIDTPDTSHTSKLKSIVQGLGTDSPEYKTTKLVIGLLFEVTKQSETNKMKPINLAIVLVPRLFSSPSDTMEALAMTTKMTSIVKVMIENYTTIFE